MKKVIFLLLLIPLLIIDVSADRIYTKIAGNKEAKAGDTVVYTVIVDKALNEYEATIEYDRNVLNLVNIEDIKLDTPERTFTVLRDNPTTVKVKSNSAVSIIYTITFTLKNNINSVNTDIQIKTIKALSGSDSLTSDSSDYRINIVKKDKLFEEENSNDNGQLDSIMSNVGKVMKKYGSPIMYGSVALNILLLILLINSIRRKKVDYDF